MSKNEMEISQNCVTPVFVLMITLPKQKKLLRQYVFPIFDNISLLSNKYYDYANPISETNR